MRPWDDLSILSNREWKYTLSLHFTETEVSASPMGHITHMQMLAYLVAEVQGNSGLD